jgi:hypothetical protein
MIESGAFRGTGEIEGRRPRVDDCGVAKQLEERGNPQTAPS